MLEVRYDRGVFLPALGLWLDPSARQEFAFVSHAHSDHVGRHGRVLCTSATARLGRARGAFEGSAFELLDYGEEKCFGGWSAELLPAGHVLGSAQIYLRAEGGSLLYTGDFKRRGSRTAGAAAARHADTLVIETTYGLPRYVFPPLEAVLPEVLKFCVEALEEGRVPVLLAYALGKAQEILAALAGAGLPLMLHGAVAKMVEVYREHGLGFPTYHPWSTREAAGHVVIAPPGASSSRALAALPRRKAAALTGWALDPGTPHRLGVDAAFPISDHADYQELLEHVAQVAPARVLTLHGFACEFARDLRARGIEAWALTGPDQLEWDHLAPPPPAFRAPAALPPLNGRGFEGFAGLCEDIRTATGRHRKIELLAAAFRKLDSRALRSAAVWLAGRALPHHAARASHIGVKIIHSALARATGLSEPALRAMAREDNDTGKTATAALAQAAGSAPRATRSISEVAALLEALAAAKGAEAKIELLATALRAMHPLAGGYLVRILTGNLRIGLKEGLVEEALAAAFDVEPERVRQAVMMSGDIGATAVLAASNRLDEAQLTLFQPAKCMLANTEPSAEAVWQRLGGGGHVWAEPKLDGLRAQAHIGGARAELFSRDLKPLTAAFPEIARAVAGVGEGIILDGEILAWDNGRPLPFSRLQPRMGRRMPDLFLPPETPAAYAVFDILMLNGQPLIHLPFHQRRAKLEALEIPKPAFVIPAMIVYSAEDLAAKFEQERAKGHEGLVVKNVASPYQPGRRGYAWIKLKRELATLDVVVVAAEFGHGRRAKVLSDLTFAVRDGERLLPIGKAYSGLTDAEIEELTARFLASTLARRGNRVEVEPEVVLEVAFDAIQPSPRHASGLALRFPRIVRWRRDKSPAEVDTLETARRLAGLA